MKYATLFLAALAAPLMAQPAAGPTEFPPEAQPLTADALKARVAGKVYSAKLADGTGWRLDYKDNGYVYVDTTKGFRDSGRWHTEDGKLCAQFQRAASGCPEVREHGDRLFMKRTTTGEVVELVPR